MTNLLDKLTRRSPASTNATSLAELGIDAATLREFKDDTRPESFTVGYLDTPDGDPIAGLVLQTDYDASQEYGIHDIANAVTGKDPRDLSMTKAGRRYVSVIEEGRGLVLGSDYVMDPHMGWDDPIRVKDSWSDTPRCFSYQEEWERSVKWHRRPEAVVFPFDTRQQLTMYAERLGMDKLPRKNADLCQRILEHPDAMTLVPDVWPLTFVCGCKFVVLRAEGDSLACRVLAKLAQAADQGYLAIGSASGPFRTGLFLYDVRDETPQLKREREERVDWREEQLKLLEPVKEELKRRGHKWFALGRPTLSKDIDPPVVRYWLNGMQGNGARTQPYGWYTLDELLAEKFVEDANIAR